MVDEEVHYMMSLKIEEEQSIGDGIPKSGGYGTKYLSPCDVILVLGTTNRQVLQGLIKLTSSEREEVPGIM